VNKQTITISNQRIAYYQFGQGSPLLFLHGGRVEARTFKKLLKELAKDNMVIAPDIPGYGDSDTPKKVWSFVEYAQFFDSFLKHLGHDHVIVVGYSMGGGIALNLAAQSSRVSQLVLMDSSGLQSLPTRHSHQDLRRLLFYLTHPQYLSSLFTLLRDFVAFSWKHRRGWRHIRDIRKQCLETSYEDALRRIIVPTTVLWGDSDWIYPSTVAYVFQQKIPQATLTFIPGNHDWPIYDPLQYKQTML
jgi:pimeloyl-ACP methyl ester carboxylesterase